MRNSYIYRTLLTFLLMNKRATLAIVLIAIPLAVAGIATAAEGAMVLIAAAKTPTTTSTSPNTVNDTAVKVHA
ncbi:MAG TPA: hypothetical protein VK553_02865 [Candidatus Nitrosopolaris rasttigaisensis]|nr:hypothetical protein [Candidatus Nitrosopolaris rasttigaisensis]